MNIQENMKVITELQDNMNCLVSEDWKTKNFPWWRAAYQECSEAVEHVGWKWWKQQDCDLYQVQLELVDIFHFIVSDYMTVKSSVDAHIRIAYDLDVVLTQEETQGNAIDALELLIKEIMVRKNLTSCNTMYLFVDAMKKVNLTLDKLFTMYVTKNALNVFRNKNGYTDGTYDKMWTTEHGVEEDNVMLERVVALSEAVDAADLFKQITTGLEIEYTEHKILKAG